ncbi:hypothetical protein KBD87_00505 [Candidatus Saccharibacteria bacterium]|nr:hypothetical protein [Candidatus Saccharibacteria bacterium]
MSGGVLQVFLMLNIFVMGGLAVFGAQHAYAHFRPKKNQKTIAEEHPVSEELRKNLLATAQQNFSVVLEKSSSQLQKDLAETTSQLNAVLEKVGADVVETEMKLYKDNLAEVLSNAKHAAAEAEHNLINHQAELEAKLAERQSAFEARLIELQTSLEGTLTSRQAEIDKTLEARKVELTTQLEAEMAAEKDRLLKKMDAKLADVVASFLTETLQHEVDLGAQETYLLEQLEAHKDELREGLGI